MGYANPSSATGRTPSCAMRLQPGWTVCSSSTTRPRSEGFAQALRGVGMDAIFLLAPTSTEARMAQVGRLASGYVYYVSLRGVTGAGHLDTGAVADMVPRIRRHVSVPVGVGFGIRDAATAKAVGAVSDAVVIGSQLVELLERQPPIIPAWPAPARPSSPKSAPRSTLSEERHMSWLDKLLPRRSSKAIRRTAAACPKACGSSARAARRCSTRPTWSRTSTSAPSARTTTASAPGPARRLPRRGRALRDRPGSAARGRPQVQGQQEVPGPPQGSAGVHRRDRRADRDGRRCDERASGRGLLRVRLHGGSMGSVVGERFVRGVETAIEQRRPSSASPPPAARGCRKACSA